MVLQTSPPPRSTSQNLLVAVRNRSEDTSAPIMRLAIQTSPKKRKTQILDELVPSPQKKVKFAKENATPNPPKRKIPSKSASKNPPADPLAASNVNPKPKPLPNPSPFKKFYEADGLRIPLYNKNGKRKQGARSAHSLAAKLNKAALLDIVEEYGGKTQRDTIANGNKNVISQWIERVETLALGGNVRKKKQAVEKTAIPDRNQGRGEGKGKREANSAPKPEAAPVQQDRVFAKPAPVAKLAEVKKQHVTAANEPRKRQPIDNKKAEKRRRQHGKEKAKHSAAAEALLKDYEYQPRADKEEDEEEEDSDEEEVAPEKEPEPEPEPEVMECHETTPDLDSVPTESMEVNDIIERTGVHPMIAALDLDPSDPQRRTLIVPLPKSRESVIVTASTWTAVHQTKIPWAGSFEQGEESDGESVESEAE
ncbi:hypothetical protein K491DRAFT_674718 [Lophiostoma macrostomum CBS 122681]|uniref:Uncharacterized protein n=1 Tax=Lophiostoma macrostomum CBS 122681 TaxID=1314788 RepID=A0A6A6TM05_9PLEO|nr:hypothetical protein K491DRAFT_674718 [Lophiostoma macrostomum CBS 122681]